MADPKLTQQPEPGRSLVRFSGDTLTFVLELSEPAHGRAFLRTNLGQGPIARQQVIRQVEQGDPPLARDWFDVPMEKVDDRRFRVTVALCQVGHFQAKCLLLQDNTSPPLWPDGPNTTLNIQPAHTALANTMYNAFVRQFGPNKDGRAPWKQISEDRVNELDGAGFTVIPPSGAFRDLARELDFILGELGCRFIQLLPVHPTPTTYGRMGRFGSPYASLSFSAVDPAQAVFDPAATPMEQFEELLDAIHARDGKVILDMAVNHTGWAARLHETHPEWLVRGPDGRIQAPGAWGVVWADLTRLDWDNQELWKSMAEVFVGWCAKGVDGFRADAGYMIPVRAWKYITAKVREAFPDVVFFLEGLGGKVSVTRRILSEANFNWAYSELFQNYDRGQLEHYLPQCWDAAKKDGVMVHFAETHDNNRLAARSLDWARMRTALCALLSHNGAFAFANGVEWFAKEKIDVHQAPSLSWGNPENQVERIRRLNELLATHPAFGARAGLSFVQEGPGDFVCVLRQCGESRLLVAANLGDGQGVRAQWSQKAAKMGPGPFTDLLENREIRPHVQGDLLAVDLAPGQILCLEQKQAASIKKEPAPPYSPTQARRLREAALSALVGFNHSLDVGGLDPDREARRLYDDPEKFFCTGHGLAPEPLAVSWRWPKDARRRVMVPPGRFLLILADKPFRAQVRKNGKVLAFRRALPRATGGWFAVFEPRATVPAHLELTLKMTVYDGRTADHARGSLLYLCEPSRARARRHIGRSQAMKQGGMVLSTNGKGAMMRAPVRWGELSSRYDGLLCANLHPALPVDRTVLWSRCRMWVVFQGFSCQVDETCLESFCFTLATGGFWRFTVPCGQGEHVVLTVNCRMEPGENETRLTLLREPDQGLDGRLEDAVPVRVVFRPDMEDRSFHDTTKAYTGPEQIFAGAVAVHERGFVFAPDPNHETGMDILPGGYGHEPEWTYMVRRPLEATRGLDPESDLFSPGYFFADLAGGKSTVLTCRARLESGVSPQAKESAAVQAFPHVRDLTVEEAARQAMKEFVVSRGADNSVIAGYPWFLDWGRDSLIFARGLVAADMRAQAKGVLRLFGRFEERGTLPNMIHGQDAANRDTSDAPLWFFTVVADILEAEGHDGFLEAACGERTIRHVLESIAESYVSGTPNGVAMDPDSGLIYSPSHYTWMDTNHPAGTPRQGFAIEIQALWHAALSLMADISGKKEKKKWEKLGRQVGESIRELFFDKGRGYLSDCIHARPGEPAKEGRADDHLRPNQLFALTLGAVKDPEVCQSILKACAELLVPGAIRSLADRPVEYELPVKRDGKLLNNPRAPYWGRYEGDEDTRRKPAYHNGTAWSWPFPSYAEAWAMTYGPQSAPTALAWLGSATIGLNSGALGHTPEVADGDAPHTPRGCDAQAWGASELYRVWKKLRDMGAEKGQGG